MIIQELRLNNFMSYYGKHVLRLQGGINFIVGSCGSGRTNLARAIQFAVLGSFEFQRKSLINFFHRRECHETGGYPFCEVEVNLEIDGTEYLCRSRVEIDEKTQIEASSYLSLEVDHIINPESYELIYLSRHSLFDEAEREHHNDRISDGLRDALFRRLNLNIAAGIKTAILDQVFDHFTYEQRKKIRLSLAELPMEQLIIIDNVEPENQERYRCRVYHVEDDMKNKSKIISPLTGKQDERKAVLCDSSSI